jgi:hypothetical protein
MAFDDEIVAGEELLTPGIKSPNYIPGSNGWRIGKEGTAEFNSIESRGDITFTNPLTLRDQSMKDTFSKLSQLGNYQMALKGQQNQASTATYTSIFDTGGAFNGNPIILNWTQPINFNLCAIVDIRFAMGVTLAGAGPLIVRCLVNGIVVDNSVGVIRLNTANDRTMLSQLWTFWYTIPRDYPLPQQGPPTVDIQMRHTSGTVPYNLEAANSTIMVTQFPQVWQTASTL